MVLSDLVDAYRLVLAQLLLTAKHCSPKIEGEQLLISSELRSSGFSVR